MFGEEKEGQCVPANNASSGIVMPELVITFMLGPGPMSRKAPPAKAGFYQMSANACILERVVNVFTQELGKRAPCGVC
jgi:hypothetical protein